ncbi:MAG: hypothetical protein AAGF23_12215 [Acidobacteriota bacterium]
MALNNLRSVDTIAGARVDAPPIYLAATGPGGADGAAVNDDRVARGGHRKSDAMTAA